MLSLGALRERILKSEFKAECLKLAKKTNNRKTGMTWVNALNLELHQIKIKKHEVQWLN